MPDPGYWIAKKLEDSPEVQEVTVNGNGTLTINRRTHSTAYVAYLSVPVFDGSAVRNAHQVHPTARFIMNLPGSAITKIDAFREAKKIGVAIGGLGDLMGAMSESDPANYVAREIKYIEKILRQHDRVSTFDRIDLTKYRISRRGLPDVTVCVGLDYEVTAEAIRDAIDKYGDFDAYVTSNPNARAVSPQAIAASRSAGRKVFLWREFMAALGRSWN
jgi:hypothetical protein